VDGESTINAGQARAPLHLWVIGVLLVLWNGLGVALAIAAQTARLPSVDPGITAYFDSQPRWRCCCIRGRRCGSSSPR
jgi:hypothetical protein